MTSITSASTLQAGTLSAFRSPDFRLYFIGQLISISGSWMQSVAQGWLVFHLTQDARWLGLVACAQGIGHLLMSPLAGALVDRLPRRNLLLLTQVGMMIPALILALLTFNGTVDRWHIAVLAFLLGLMTAIDAPSRQSIIVDLVGHERLTSGIALNSIMFNLSRVIGPALAGIALTQFGAGWCFLLNGLSYIPVFFLLFFIHPAPALEPDAAFAPLRRAREGFAFARRHEVIAPLILIVAIFSLCTANLMTLLPAFADVTLGSPKEAYAAISAFTGVGAVVGGLLMTPLGRRYGRGRVVRAAILSVMLLGVLLSLQTWVPAAVALAALFGFSFILQLVTMNTLVQSVTPDAFRGRVMSLYTLTFFGVAPFGALVVGLAAEQIGIPLTMALSALSGGLLSLVVLVRSPGTVVLR